MKMNLQKIKDALDGSGRYTPLLLNRDKPEKVLFKEFLMQYYSPLLNDLETTFGDWDKDEKKTIKHQDSLNDGD
jgi:hypothetical protein